MIDSAGRHGKRRRTEATQDHYVASAACLGIPRAARMAIGAEAVAKVEGLCLEVALGPGTTPRRLGNGMVTGPIRAGQPA